MCEWANKIAISINGKLKNIDSCIVPLVQALNQCGVKTIASCCGHGRRPGNIIIENGREIIICPDWKTGRAIDNFLNTAGYYPISYAKKGKLNLGGQIDNEHKNRMGEQSGRVQRRNVESISRL